MTTTVIFALTLSLPARAGDPVASGSATGSASDKAPEIPLPELPDLPAIEHPTPSADASRELEERLAQLLETEVSGPLDPEPDLRFLTADLDESAVPAIAQRLQDLRESVKSEEARRLLEDARKAGRKALRKQRKARKGDDDSEGDWLTFILSLRRGEDAAWRGSAQLYGMLRMLETLGTTPAVRQMIESYSYFGELVRIDLQRAVERLKDRAVPALLEAKKHDAKKVRRWAGRQLDSLGRAIPGESVSMTDPTVLADVLLAFGRLRDVDATRVLLSFANSDRVQLREAARAAVGAIGEPATWHLKDTYKNLTGDKAPRSWDSKRTARELFRLHDRSRLALVYQQMDHGAEALAGKRYADAVEAFDQVLARVPLFDRRKEMAPAYLEHGSALLAKEQWEEASSSLRKALRLDPDLPQRQRIEAQLALIEGRALIEAGTPDRIILERVLKLDPGNEQAKALLASLEQESEVRQQESRRYVAAGGVVLLALVLLVLLGWRRKPTRAAPGQQEAATPGPDSSPAEPAAADTSAPGPTQKPMEIGEPTAPTPGLGDAEVPASPMESPALPTPGPVESETPTVPIDPTANLPEPTPVMDQPPAITSPTGPAKTT